MEIETNIDGNELKVKYNKRPIILASSTLIALIITVTGIIVYFSVDKSISTIVLWVLLGLMIALALCMITYSIYLRKHAEERKVNGAERRWVRSDSTFEARLNMPKPSAPPMSLRASWALNPRKWSNTTTLPIYHQTAANPPQIIIE